MTANTMNIDGYTAVIAYDPELEMFRGEFLQLNGGADFYAPDVVGLRREGAISLQVFLQACAEKGIEPRKRYSGRLLLRVDPALHETAALAAAASGQSLNKWVEDVVLQAVR
ncbi:MAG: type II toxin-antitoxin system HicB family antitoxin [Curvibacter sp.]|nr:MAG: type II toxin-antitoxin system HicB family antitoxin [Curvibacter sp.]